MSTWQDGQTPHIDPPGGAGWARIIARGLPLALFIAVCFVLQQALRLIERPVFGTGRPLSPWFTVAVCRVAFWILGIRYVRHGKPMKQHGAMVANHVSWLDIFSLNAAGPLYFVSKAEVSGWPGIGLLARGTGTLFIARDRKQAREQTALFEDRLLAGHKLLFFPEGTSTDGQRVLPFKSTLFQAFFTEHLRDEIAIQPVSLRYHAPAGEVEWFYGWWGDMEFGPHLLHTLAAPRQGRIEVTYHEPLPVSAFADRKTLAARAEARVRDGALAPQDSLLQ